MVRIWTAEGMHVLRNEVDSGHGPFLDPARPAGRGARPGGDIIVGSRTATGSSERWKRSPVDIVLDTHPEVVEGIRTPRDDPWFRRTTSATTRQMVRSTVPGCRSGREHPAPGVPPIGVGSPGCVPSLDPPPPLRCHVRVHPPVGHVVAAIPVASLPRRGSTSKSVTWKQRRRGCCRNMMSKSVPESPDSGGVGHQRNLSDQPRSSSSADGSSDHSGDVPSTTRCTAPAATGSAIGLAVLARERVSRDFDIDHTELTGIWPTMHDRSHLW